MRHQSCLLRRERHFSSILSRIDAIHCRILCTPITLYTVKSIGSSHLFANIWKQGFSFRSFFQRYLACAIVVDSTMIILWARVMHCLFHISLAGNYVAAISRRSWTPNFSCQSEISTQNEPGELLFAWNNDRVSDAWNFVQCRWHWTWPKRKFSALVHVPLENRRTSGRLENSSFRT